MDFSKRLKELREKNKLSQTDLANEINAKVDRNIKRTTISNWENKNAIPDLYILIALCEILHITSDYLLGIDKIDVGPLVNEDIPSYSYLQAIGQKIDEIVKIQNDPNADLETTREYLKELTGISKELVKKADDIFVKHGKAIRYINQDLRVE
ncbi:MAG: helix-turn-helix domain-containing protein [Cytophagales bacterium]|nr:helix-turn-helix domain-containing protein [Cytophagales bacterium]